MAQTYSIRLIAYQSITNTIYSRPHLINVHLFLRQRTHRKQAKQANCALLVAQLPKALRVCYIFLVPLQFILKISSSHRSPVCLFDASLLIGHQMPGRHILKEVNACKTTIKSRGEQLVLLFIHWCSQDAFIKYDLPMQLIFFWQVATAK